MKGRNGREKQNNNEKKVQGSDDTKINKSDIHWCWSSVSPCPAPVRSPVTCFHGIGTECFSPVTVCNDDTCVCVCVWLTNKPCTSVMRKWTWAFHPTSLITTVSLLIRFHLKTCLLYLRLRSALLWSTRTSKKTVWKASDPVLPPSHSTRSNHVSCHVSYFTTYMNLLWGLIFLLRPIYPPSPQTTSALLFQPCHFNIKHWLEI